MKVQSYRRIRHAYSSYGYDKFEYSENATKAQYNSRYARISLAHGANIAIRKDNVIGKYRKRRLSFGFTDFF